MATASPSPRSTWRAANAPGDLLQQVGEAALAFAAVLGGLSLLFGRILWRLLRLAFDRHELLVNLEKMAVRSLSIVVVTAIFTGAIMVVQAAPLIERYQAHGLLGWGAGFGTLREIGPLLVALMISGRVGANNAAELGTMVVTEQVDALRTLAIDPLSFLVVPRFIGIVATLFLSTSIAIFIALLGAAFAGQAIVGVEPAVFYGGFTAGLLGVGDLLHGLAKSVLFGIVIALASCHFGMTTTGGAPGVGRAVNASVVTSAVGIFLVDYAVSFLLA